MTSCGNLHSNSNQSTPQGNTVEAKGDELTVEEFYIDDYGSYYYTYAKIRNNTDQEIEHFTANFQVIDKNGDIIDTGDFIEATKLSPGQAITSEDQARLADGLIENVGSFKFTSFEIHDLYIENGQDHMRTICSGDFSQSPIFNANEITINKKR